MAIALLPILIGYLIGGIPFGLIIARLWGIKDIRRHGSGNIGATNVWRVAGWKAALWVFALDIGKGASAVLIARMWSQNVASAPVSADIWLALCGLSSIIGHVFPVFLGFKGGKGVNTALGVMIVLLPLESAIGAAVFVISLLLTKYVSLSSILASSAFAVFTCYEKFAATKEISGFLTTLTVLIAILIIATHHRNISRLIAGTENRVKFGGHTKNKQPKEVSRV